MNSCHAAVCNVMQWSVKYILTADNSKEAYDIAIIGTLKTYQFYYNHLDMHLISVYY